MARGGLGRQMRADAAILVALFLVVQAFAAGFAGGARADTALAGLDVICAGDGSSGSASGSPAGDLLHLADCCTLGCPMIGGLPPAAAAPLHHPPGVASEKAGLRHDASPVRRAELAPLNTRAPPRV